MVHSADVPPVARHASTHSTYVRHPGAPLCSIVSPAHLHHCESQCFVTHVSHVALPVLGVHALASPEPPLDEPLPSLPDPLPEEPPVDASPAVPAENGSPPQSAASAIATGNRSRPPTRRERRITKPDGLSRAPEREQIRGWPGSRGRGAASMPREAGSVAGGLASLA